MRRLVCEQTGSCKEGSNAAATAAEAAAAAVTEAAGPVVCQPFLPPVTNRPVTRDKTAALHWRPVPAVSRLGFRQKKWVNSVVERSAVFILFFEDVLISACGQER